MVNKSAGFAYISYVIGAIALAGVVTAAIHLSTVKATRTTNNSQIIQTISGQGASLVSSMLACIYSYPEEYTNAVNYGWTKNITSSTGLTVSGNIDWDRVPYPLTEDMSMKYLECPGLRIRYCPADIASNDSAAQTNTICEKARIFGKDVDNVSFTLPDGMTQSYQTVFENNEIWNVARVSSFTVQKETTDPLKNLVTGSQDAILLIARLKVLAVGGSHSTNEAFATFKAVAKNLRAYDPCLTRRENANSVFLIFPLSGDIDRTLCN